MITLGLLSAQFILENSIGILKSEVAFCSASLLQTQTIEGYAVALTAGHCIADLKPNEIILHKKNEISLFFREKKIKAKSILYASISPYDFALIELNIKFKKIKKSFKLFPIGKIDTPKLIFGYPLQVLNSKLLTRNCRVNKKNMISNFFILNEKHIMYHEFLLSCFAYPGMSGGPLINDQYEIVGVISSQSEDGLLITGIPPMKFFYWLLGLKNNDSKKYQDFICRT